ncbi:hypothetical protein, partial [Ottowia sp.]|uniref:hypothetical protein n=1 Tax=Ottowia sp. TaxID=1898956 RepID=UPI00345E59A3
MAKYDVAGTAPTDSGATVKQEGVLPTVAALVGVPLRAAAVPGVILGLVVVIVAVVVIVFAGLAAEPEAWLVAGAGALVVCLGVTLKLWPERYREVLPAIYKREVAEGRDINGDGMIGAPRDPIPARSQGKPADARGEARRAL